MLHQSRWLRQLAITLIVVIVAFEVTCRWVLGLGQPVLVVRDDNCGYRFAPAQSVTRFGNRVTYDDKSCRGSFCISPSVRPWTTLVVGDSVLDGLALTDDADTATGLLNSCYVDCRGRRLLFRNLSGGSWGPPQQLGYINAYGIYDANAIVLVINVGDATSQTVRSDPLYPTRNPWLAAEELVLRYGLRFRQHLLGQNMIGSEARAANIPPTVSAEPSRTAESCWCLEELLRLAKQKGVPMAIVVWPTLQEAIEGRLSSELAELKKVAERNEAPWISLLKKVCEVPDFASLLYRDKIHPTPLGTRIIAGSLLEVTREMLDYAAPTSGTALPLAD